MLLSWLGGRWFLLRRFGFLCGLFLLLFFDGSIDGMLDDRFRDALAHGPFDGLLNLPDGFLFGLFLRHCVSRIAAEQSRLSMAFGDSPLRRPVAVSGSGGADGS